jgi:NAD(P)-dependent dehydrogenase (short-subunit alcohol dehydrogenase family)
LRQKIALVTGGNSGMGLATVIGLARGGYRVVMACRNAERGETARREAGRQSGSTAIETMTCDLGSLASIREFADRFLTRFDTLDVLVNNAGVVTVRRYTTSDGFEAMMGVNHLGHFLLTNLLLPALRRSPQGRIVVVSSGAHKAGTIRFEDPHLAKRFHVVAGYGQSKLANILFTQELAERLKDTNITVNAVHPGAVATNLGVDRQTGFGKFAYRLLRPWMQTPAQGASTALYLAMSDEAAGVSGQYFYKKKPAAVSAKASDALSAKRLWAWSEQQVGLTRDG